MQPLFPRRSVPWWLMCVCARATESERPAARVAPVGWLVNRQCHRLLRESAWGGVCACACMQFIVYVYSHGRRLYTYGNRHVHSSWMELMALLSSTGIVRVYADTNNMAIGTATSCTPVLRCSAMPRKQNAHEVCKRADTARDKTGALSRSSVR